MHDHCRPRTWLPGHPPATPDGACGDFVRLGGCLHGYSNSDADGGGFRVPEWTGNQTTLACQDEMSTWAGREIGIVGSWADLRSLICWTWDAEGSEGLDGDVRRLRDVWTEEYLPPPTASSCGLRAVVQCRRYITHCSNSLAIKLRISD
jgi:hypothetical protein